MCWLLHEIRHIHYRVLRIDAHTHKPHCLGNCLATPVIVAGVAVEAATIVNEIFVINFPPFKCRAKTLWFVLLFRLDYLAFLFRVVVGCCYTSCRLILYIFLVLFLLLHPPLLLPVLVGNWYDYKSAYFSRFLAIQADKYTDSLASMHTPTPQTSHCNTDQLYICM